MAKLIQRPLLEGVIYTHILDHKGNFAFSKDSRDFQYLEKDDVTFSGDRVPFKILNGGNKVVHLGLYYPDGLKGTLVDVIVHALGYEYTCIVPKELRGSINKDDTVVISVGDNRYTAAVVKSHSIAPKYHTNNWVVGKIATTIYERSSKNKDKITRIAAQLREEIENMPELDVWEILSQSNKEIKILLERLKELER